MTSSASRPEAPAAVWVAVGCLIAQALLALLPAILVARVLVGAAPQPEILLPGLVLGGLGVVLALLLVGAAVRLVWARPLSGALAAVLSVVAGLALSLFLSGLVYWAAVSVVVVALGAAFLCVGLMSTRSARKHLGGF